MVESTLDIAEEALQSDTAVYGGAAHELHGFFDSLDRGARRDRLADENAVGRLIHCV
jgi:hypothetical protein